MRPPYYLLQHRSSPSRGHTHAAMETRGSRFVLFTCSIVLAGLIAVAFLSGW